MIKFMKQVKAIMRAKRKRVHELCSCITSMRNYKHFMINTGRKKGKKDGRFYN